MCATATVPLGKKPHVQDRALAEKGLEPSPSEDAGLTRGGRLPSLTHPATRRSASVNLGGPHRDVWISPSFCFSFFTFPGRSRQKHCLVSGRDRWMAQVVGRGAPQAQLGAPWWRHPRRGQSRLWGLSRQSRAFPGVSVCGRGGLCVTSQTFLGFPSCLGSGVLLSDLSSPSSLRRRFPSPSSKFPFCFFQDVKKC